MAGWSGKKPSVGLAFVAGIVVGAWGMIFLSLTGSTVESAESENELSLAQHPNEMTLDYLTQSENESSDIEAAADESMRGPGPGH